MQDETCNYRKSRSSESAVEENNFLFSFRRLEDEENYFNMAGSLNGRNITAGGIVFVVCSNLFCFRRRGGVCR